MVRRSKLHFEGRELRQARQIKFLILFGHSRAQIFFQSPFSWSGCSTTWRPTSSSFKNQYLNLQLKLPSCSHGQNRESSVAFLAKGIFFISLASCGAKIPSTIAAFQVLVPSSIKQSTVASSIVSTIGESTLVGCFRGNQWCCQIFMDLPFPTLQQAPSRITP